MKKVKIEEADLKLAEILIRKAECDFNLAKMIMNNEEQQDNCGLHLQQAVEKLVKALIICKGGSFETARGKGHDLEYLAATLANLGFADMSLKGLLYLSDFAVAARYDFVYDNHNFKGSIILIDKLISFAEMSLRANMISE